MRHLGLVVLAGFAFALAACTSQSGTAQSGAASPTPVPTALPPVAQAAPQPLPAWIEEISPKGEAGDGAQIRIRFKSEIAPLEALESTETVAALSHVQIDPPLPGRFVLLTPKMIGFEADAPVPHGSRVAITLTAGLADLKGDTLGADYRWTFTTKPITIADLQGKGMTGDQLDPVGLTPQIPVTSSDAVDVDSLVAHAHLVAAGASPIPLIVAPSPTGSPADASAGSSETPPAPNSADTSQTYVLQPQTALQRNTTYAITIDAGVMPQFGNIATSSSSSGNLRTYGDLTFTGIDAVDKPDRGADATFTGGTPSLSFDNGLDAASALKAITVSPTALPGVTLLGLSDGDASVAVNSVGLKPNTTYTFTIADTLTDKFGQTLGKPVTASFTTGDYVGNVWAPNGLTIFPAGPDLRLDVQTTNLPEGGYRFASRVVSPLDLIANDLTQADATAFVGPSPWPRVAVAAQKNVPATTAISLKQRLGSATGVLAYAVSAREFQYPDGKGHQVWNEPVYSGFAELTNLGVFAQLFPNDAVVRVHHLTDGMPVQHARVDLYESLSDRDADDQDKLATAARTPCASGATDAQGVWHLDNAAFTKCASTATDATDAPALLAIVREGGDWAWVRVSSYSGASVGDVYAGWSAGAPQSYGTIANDRSLYQPGEHARFTAIGYFDEDGQLERGRSKSYDVTISDPEGKAKDVGTYSLDRFGAFSLEYAIPSKAETGYYSIVAHGSNGEQIEGTFRIAEFKPPTFSVALGLGAETAVAGGSMHANVKSTYLFGAPVEGATTRVTVTRQQGYVQPAGWDAFGFGREWDWPEEPPSVEPEVSQSDIKTAGDGTVAADIPISNDLPYPMTYTVDANTTDVSNMSVADTKTFTALPSDALIGVKSDFVATAGTPFTVSTIVTDPHGAAVTGKSVHLVLQRRDDVAAQQLEEGSETSRQAVHYSDVASADVAPGSSAADARLTAPKPGSYRIVANFADATGPATETDRFLWVSGPGETNWFARDPNQLTIKLDKKKYRPGETATALIQSPFDQAEVYLAVIRHGVLYQTTQVVKGAAPQIRFPVTAAMLPNAAVEAVVVRRGPSLASGIPAGLGAVGKLAKVGMEPFEVVLDAKYVKLAIAPQIPRVLPGGKQHVAFTLTGADGKPASGEIVVAVVNDAILQLTGYRYPDLVSLVYADEPISERFGDNRFLVQLATQSKTVDKGFGYGGGASAGLGSTRVRTKFEPLAYFNGNVIAGASGTASVDFTLPDDLTTWRVMAMALTPDARFGTSDATFIASKPLVTEAILPQFARPGDRFSAGVAVTDIAKTGGTVDVAGELGGALGFGDSQTPNPTATLSAPIDSLTAAYRFDVAVDGTQDSTVKFSTKLGPNSDAFQVALPIRTQDVTEDVVETGTTQTQASVPLSIDPNFPQDVGGMTVSLASTLLPDALAVVNRLHEDSLPFATSLASRIAIASDGIVLDKLYARPAEIPALQKSLARDLVDLRALALPDGGFAEFPKASESELYSTAFVATQLVQAKRAGIDVDADLAHVRTFLNARLADPGDACGSHPSDLCLGEARLEALETLGTMGDARPDHLDEIVRVSGQFSYYEQIELARHMAKVPAWRVRGLALRDKLLEQLYETGRRATINEPAYDWESQASGQGQVVGLMIETHVAADRVDRAFTSLMGLRKNGVWGCLCDDAEALNAVVTYAQAQGPPPDFSAFAKFGANTEASGQFHGYRTTSTTTVVPMHALPHGSQQLVLSKTGTGTLHYAIDLTYGITGDAPGIYQGIRIDRNVRDAGAAPIIATFGLAKPAAPTLDPGRVYEIEDRITTDHSLDDVLVTDPLPAGFEAVDTTLRTTSSAYVANTDSWQIDYQQIYRDRVLSYASHLEAGTYAIHYLVRSVTPGTFSWPAAQVSLQYAPDEFGRTSQTTLTIAPLK